MSDTAPYQRQRGNDFDCRYAKGYRGVFQDRPDRVYQDRTGGAGHLADHRHHQEKEAACDGAEAGWGAGTADV